MVDLQRHKLYCPLLQDTDMDTLKVAWLRNLAIYCLFAKALCRSTLSSVIYPVTADFTAATIFIVRLFAPTERARAFLHAAAFTKQLVPGVTLFWFVAQVTESSFHFCKIKNTIVLFILITCLLLELWLRKSAPENAVISAAQEQWKDSLTLFIFKYIDPSAIVNNPAQINEG